MVLLDRARWVGDENELGFSILAWKAKIMSEKHEFLDTFFRRKIAKLSFWAEMNFQISQNVCFMIIYKCAKFQFFWASGNENLLVWMIKDMYSKEHRLHFGDHISPQERSFFMISSLLSRLLIKLQFLYRFAVVLENILNFKWPLYVFFHWNLSTPYIQTDIIPQRRHVGALL